LLKNKNIHLRLDTIKFKIDLHKINLFLETNNPEINYENLKIPIKNIKVYIDFLSLFKSKTKITKINLIFNEIDIFQLRELSSIIKPSNFKTLINNKIKQGNLISEVDVFLNEDGSLKNFIARGTVKALRAELSKNLNLNIESLNFFSDKSDILIKNIFGNIEKIQILEGNIKLNLENGVEVSSNFDTKFDIDEKFFIKYSKLIQ